MSSAVICYFEIRISRQGSCAEIAWPRSGRNLNRELVLSKCRSAPQRAVPVAVANPDVAATKRMAGTVIELISLSAVIRAIARVPKINAAVIASLRWKGFEPLPVDPGHLQIVRTITSLARVGRTCPREHAENRKQKASDHHGAIIVQTWVLDKLVDDSRVISHHAR